MFETRQPNNTQSIDMTSQSENIPAWHFDDSSSLPSAWNPGSSFSFSWKVTDGLPLAYSAQ
jgi:hypothetical protein